MSRKTSKERREEKTRRDKALQVENAIAIKTQIIMTGSATEPAYLFTSLCPDPERSKAKFFSMLKTRNITRQSTENKVSNLGTEEEKENGF